MTTVHDIETALFAWAPKTLAVGGDRVGLQAGERRLPVRHVLVSLDVTQDVIFEALSVKANLIVSHHGLLYHSVPPTDDTDAGAVLLSLCRSGLASVAMHTNLDAAQGGVNDVLALRLGLANVRIFDEKDGIGRMGILFPPSSAQAYAAHCKKALGCGVVRYFDAKKPVETVAVCSGGGDSLLEDAIRAGCDTFVTADIKHHRFLTAQNYGINLLDCGHFATENIIVPEIAAYLTKSFPGLLVSISNADKEPFVCL